MKQHVFGIALMMVIVGVFAIGYEYLSPVAATDCGKSDYDKCAPAPKPTDRPHRSGVNYDAKDVGVRLDYVESSMKYKTVKARLNLKWNGDEAPPRSVWVQMEFRNFDGSSAGWISQPVNISEPFDREVEPMFECERCGSLPRNLYATVKVWSNETRLSNAYEKVMLNSMKPVLILE